MFTFFFFFPTGHIMVALPGVKVKIKANSHCDDKPGVTVALNAGRRQNVPPPPKDVFALILG